MDSKSYKGFCDSVIKDRVSKSVKLLPKPKAWKKGLDDIRAEIPQGGLSNPRLRKMDKFDTQKLHKKLFGK
jgi:hypothetical protein